ncbi:hypothetical protein SDC9_151838 [bioreactor metagenome]|uniref:Uncharacterized protein n=1 Tax=bioreactor metagenome TaxID=1076179 RepID=A0A645ET46_9ZZZZ
MRISVGEFEQANFGVAQGEPKSVIIRCPGERGKPPVLQPFQQRRRASGIGQRLYRRHVQRVGQRGAARHWSIPFPVEIDRREHSGSRWKIGRHIGKDGCRGGATLKRQHEGKRLEGRAG